ncbi:hypothetical protein AB0C59_07905 [Streptomyces sp. NPDC048664]|uniref:hypothetical protein n=1 Tax=Streptomyces sp. NPDC048664 TaxID=3154505 RepID=UPI00343B007F
MFGHSSITITADTYTSLLPETDLALAEAAAMLVPRARTAPAKAAPVPDVPSEENADRALRGVPWEELARDHEL